ncbi:Pimeloyl-ACP methyl ester carboxylesterase [Albimonas donghaensis]|uniref:Pimeloyl-ACP methyl ester carboxylesterase n=1 Tax=Albimonas donghaensis TaxID=356660 RepID=A0A1H2TJ26_9RHOB|nr:alpha/beta hydrolase [Albimonas donghaensis]SDW43695.1 Pimeloyl-ACP methyl ester carboxylesterase [Albimonas donghaensis]
MIPSSARIEADNPPTGRFVTSEGLRIHYVALGPEDPDAPTAILIHGATGNLNDMTFDLGPRLAAQGVRVICFDRPGLGHSERAPVEGWLPSTQARVLEGASRALGLRRAVLIGHSWGGAVALAWAIAAPARAAGAVILAGASMPWGDPPGFWTPVVTSRPFAAVAAGVLRLTALHDDGASAAARIFRPQPVPEGYMAHLQPELILRPATFRNNTEDIERLDPALSEQSRHYPNLRVPLEIVHGSADEIVWLSVHSEPLSKLAPDAKLHVLEGVGHMLHHVEPQVVTAAAARLFDREAHSGG